MTSAAPRPFSRNIAAIVGSADLGAKRSLCHLSDWPQVWTELLAGNRSTFLAGGRLFNLGAPLGRDGLAAFKNLVNGRLCAANRVGQRLFSAAENCLCPQEGFDA